MGLGSLSPNVGKMANSSPRLTLISCLRAGVSLFYPRDFDLVLEELTRGIFGLVVSNTALSLMTKTDASMNCF